MKVSVDDTILQEANALYLKTRPIQQRKKNPNLSLSDCDL